MFKTSFHLILLKELERQPSQKVTGESTKEKYVLANSKTFTALCVGTGFAVAFVAGWILFAAVVGYHLN
jgi:hypothetical protein